MAHPENDIANACLLKAAKEGDLQGVKDALKDGARINKTDSDGYTAFLIAAKRGDAPMSDYLLKQGAAVDFLDNEGCDALMLAIKAGHSKLAKQFLTLPFNLAAANENGKTAYLLAAENNLPQVMADLESRHVDTKVQDKTGATALMLAAQGDGLPKGFVHLLRRDQPALEVKDNDGRTILMRQLNRGTSAARKVRALLQSGADVSQIDNRHRSVKDIARLWGMEDLVAGAFENYDVKRLTEGSGRAVPVLKKIRLKR